MLLSLFSAYAPLTVLHSGLGVCNAEVTLDGLSPLFCNNAGDVLTSNSTKHVGAIWERDLVQKHQYESVILLISKAVDILV